MLVRDESSSVELYRFPRFAEAGFTAFVTGRDGGVSPAPFDTLNTAGNGGDDPANARENLTRIRKAVGVEALWTPNQVHGDQIALIGEAMVPAQTADAVIATKPGVAVAVRTADCLPVLLADPQTGVVAAVHAGRKGVELSLARSVVETMAALFNGEPDEMLVALAPSIRQCCYEIDAEGAARFASCCGGHADGRMIDLIGATMEQLQLAGVRRENIEDAATCTSCERDRFFSYRADAQRTGRFLSGVISRSPLA